MTLLPILGIIIAILLSGLRIAQEYQRAVVFRLGRFQSIKGPGFIGLSHSLTDNKGLTSEQKRLTLNNKRQSQKIA